MKYIITTLMLIAFIVSSPCLAQNYNCNAIAELLSDYTNLCVWGGDHDDICSDDQTCAIQSHFWNTWYNYCWHQQDDMSSANRETAVDQVSSDMEDAADCLVGSSSPCSKMTPAEYDALMKEIHDQTEVVVACNNTCSDEDFLEECYALRLLTDTLVEDCDY